MKKFILGVIAGVMLVCTTFAVAYVTHPLKESFTGKEFISQPSNEQPIQAEAEPTPSSTNVNNNVQTNDKWKVTFLNVKEYEKIGNFTEPEKGKIFLLAFFEVENISTQTQTFGALNISGYIDGYKMQEATIFESVDGVYSLGDTIDAGKKTKGFIAYEIDGDWSELTISYNDSFNVQDTSNKLEFIINK